MRHGVFTHPLIGVSRDFPYPASLTVLFSEDTNLSASLLVLMHSWLFVILRCVSDVSPRCLSMVKLFLCPCTPRLRLPPDKPPPASLSPAPNLSSPYSSSSLRSNSGSLSPHPSHPSQPIATLSTFPPATPRSSLTTTTSCFPSIANPNSALAASNRFLILSSFSVLRPFSRCLSVDTEGGERKRNTGSSGGDWSGALERSWRTPWSSMSRIHRRGLSSRRAAKVVP